jgi:class 3 adenylate cyclase
VKTRYARLGDSNIAYQVTGAGERDVVLVPSFVSHLDLLWANPVLGRFFERTAEFSRLIVFDKLGTGLSDPVASVPTIEERVSEVEAVMAAARCERATLFGLSEGAPTSLVLAAMRPEQVEGLVIFGGFACPLDAENARTVLLDRGLDEYAPTDAQIARMARFREAVFGRWGEGEALACLLPSVAEYGQGRRTLELFERCAASPGMARATLEAASHIDVIDVLPTIRAPTLVVHFRDDLVPVQYGRLIADLVPGARILELDGRDHAPWLAEDPDAVLSEVEEFVTGTRHAPAPERALATVLFTDIVGSTERAAVLGDRAWRDLLERHDALVHAEIDRGGGRAVKSTGDGILATFDGPAQALRCARSLIAAVEELGIEIRAGAHTGEVELIGNDVGGMAVHIGARVAAEANAGEILVSRTVRDLMIGSGIDFEGRGRHALKGVSDEWELFAAETRTEPRSEEAEIARIETPAAREGMRTGDKVTAALARWTPGTMRTLAAGLSPQTRERTQRISRPEG